MSRTHVFFLPNVRCINCIESLRKAFDSLSGFEFDAVTKELTLELPDSVLNAEIKSILKKQGHSFYEKRNHFALGILGTVSGFGLLALSFLGVALPLPLLIALGVVSMGLTLYLGYDTYRDAFRQLFKQQTLTMDTLFTLSTFVVLGLSTAAFFVPGLPLMMDAALLILGFRHLGLAIESSIKKTLSLGKKFVDRIPEKHRKIKEEEMLTLSEREVIPVDGVCLSEGAEVLETIRNGSIYPRILKKGDEVLAGMELIKGSKALTIQATKSFDQSTLAQMDHLIKKSIQEKAPIEETTQRILQVFIPLVMGVAILSGLMVGLYATPVLGLITAASVLVSACPCTLGLVVPLAVRIGMGKALKHGVQFKSAKRMQEANAIDTVVFDLNGTLTEGSPKVIQGCDDPFLLSCLAGLEKGSHHPIGIAIAEYAKSAPPLSFDVINELEGKFKGDSYVLGHQGVMKKLGITSGIVQAETGQQVIYLAKNKLIVARLVIEDQLRPHALQTMNGLKKLGKTIHLCTGADEPTARRYAKALGIDVVEAECQDKKGYIEALIQKGCRVAMVGDAGNDALAIAASSFGLAIQSKQGDDITQQNAHALIPHGSLLPVYHAFVIARQTAQHIQQTLFFSLSYNALALMVSGGLLVALGLMIHPGIGAALMIAQTSLILLNAWRVAAQKLPEIEQKKSEVTSSYSKLKVTLGGVSPSCLNNEPLASDSNRHGLGIFNRVGLTDADRHLPKTELSLNELANRKGCGFN